MQPEIKTWLFDVLHGIAEIDTYFENGYLFQDFVTDTKTQRAVERNIEIIGEAINRVLHKNSDIAITNARLIVQTRNYIAHSYDKIAIEVIWSIIVKHLPLLKQEVQELLNKLN